MRFNQTKHTETERERKLLNGRMFQFILNHSFYCVPMKVSKIDGRKKPKSGYRWANFSEEQYKLELERAQVIQNSKLRQSTLNDLNRKYTGVQNLQRFNRELSLINTAKRSNDPYLIDSVKDDYKLIINNENMTGILTQENNLLVFDCDTEDHNSGDVTHAPDCPSLHRLKEWCDSHGLSFDMFQNTFTVRTTSGGYHFYFYYTGDVIKRQIGFVKKVDLITGRGLIIAPYSAKTFIDNGQVIRYLPVQLQFDNGQIKYSYLRLSKANEIQMLPNELEQAIINFQPVTQKKNLELKPFQRHTITDADFCKGQSILKKHLNKFAHTEEGQRNDALRDHVRVVFRYYSYLSRYSPSEITEMFKEKALTLGLTEAEIDATILSAMNFGLQRQLKLN